MLFVNRGKIRSGQKNANCSNVIRYLNIFATVSKFCNLKRKFVKIIQWNSVNILGVTQWVLITLLEAQRNEAKQNEIFEQKSE